MPLDTGRIQKNIRKLRKILKNDAKLRSPKRLHQLRTRTRRIESTLSAIRLDSRRNGKRLLRELGPIRKRAGKVRDMDVLTSYLLDLQVDCNRERECAIQLLEFLGDQRYRLARKLRRVVRTHRNEARMRLKHLSKEIESIADHDPDGSTKGRRPQNEAAASALAYAGSLAEPKTLNRDNLHAYRLKVKKLRYVLTDARPETDQPFIDALGKCKDAIGEWHDWEELVAMAAEALDHGRGRRLIEQLKVVSRKKFEAALATTNSMRSRFITRRHVRRGSSRKTRLSVGLPGLQAAAAIASR